MRRHLRSHAVATNLWVVVYWLLQDRLNPRQGDVASHHRRGVEGWKSHSWNPKHACTVAVWILDDSAPIWVRLCQLGLKGGSAVLAIL